MHKWKLFKKSVALVLSSAVIASGMPVTAMASEAEVFSDVSEEKMEETAQEADEEFQPESSEESDVEDIRKRIQSFPQKSSSRKKNCRIRKMQKMCSAMEMRSWQKREKFFRMLLKLLWQE